MAKVDINLRLCQYTRIGTEARWEPIDSGEYFDNLQKEFDELKAKLEKSEAEVDRLTKKLKAYDSEGKQYCGHHYVGNRCTICGKVVTDPLRGIIG